MSAFPLKPSARSHKRKASELSDVTSIGEASPRARRRGRPPKRHESSPSQSPSKLGRRATEADDDEVSSYIDDDLDAEGEDDVYMDEETTVADAHVESTPVRKARAIRLTNRPRRSAVSTPLRRTSMPDLEEEEEEPSIRSRRTSNRPGAEAVRESHTRPPTFSEEPEISEEAKQAAKLEKEEADMRNRWMEEYFEIVEQLPLEVHRMFALIRELEGQTHSRFNRVLQNTVAYRDARLELNKWIEANAKKPADAVAPRRNAQQATEAASQGEESRDEESDTSEFLDLTARKALLRTISNAANESVKGAEEKMGLAISAYNLIDRHIRRLDGDISKMESSILLGLRSGTEESRGVREVLGLPVDDAQPDEDPKQADKRNAGLTEEAESASLAKAAGANKRIREVRGTRASVGSSSAGASRSRASTAGATSTPASKNTKASGSKLGVQESAQLSVSGMAYDPTEPTYCYCDQVSVDEMVACENNDCKLEWFHYTCVGLETAPKGKWYCRFCAPPSWKGPGMAVPANAKFKPPGWKKGGIKG